jgi:hypothetical protein
MIGFMNEIMEFLPVVTAAGGYAAGQVMEQVAQNRIARNREQLIGAHEIVEGGYDGRQSRLSRATAVLAIMGATAGLAIGEAVKPHETHIETRAYVAAPVDHSIAVSNDNKQKLIDSTAAKLMETDGITSQALMATGGDYKTVKKSAELTVDDPYGPQSMAEATKAAMDNAYSNANAMSSTGGKTSAGVFVVTDGSSIGRASTVVSRAHERGNLPIFIANAGEDDSPTAKDLKLIAKQTNGQYWHITPKTTGIEDKIATQIVPHEITAKANGERLPWGIAAALLLGGMAKQFKRRERETAVS